MLKLNLWPCLFGSKELQKIWHWTINQQELVEYLNYKFGYLYQPKRNVTICSKRNET